VPEDTLYDRDFYAWTAEQAERVRRLPADCGVDVANVVEELESLGRWHRQEVEDNLESALAYALCWAFDDYPNAALRNDVSEPGWTWSYEYELETGKGLSFARSFYEPSMCEDIAIGEVWHRAILRANCIRAKQRKAVFQDDLPCPFKLVDLLPQLQGGHRLRDRIAERLR
jgi:hypothetical protein